MKLYEIIDLIEEWAPLALQEEWDNSGLQVGDKNREIKSVLISLDCTEEVVDYAISIGADLIINHHPLIFSPLKSIRKEDYISRILVKAIKADISIYAAHTNLDAAKGGVNDILADKLDFQLDHVLDENEEGLGIGRYGNIPKISLESLADYISKSLNTNVVYYGDKESIVDSIAISGGSGGSMIDLALEKKVDVLLTGDIKHHDYLDALGQGLAIIDAGHYSTEEPICYEIEKFIKSKGIDKVEVFNIDRQENYILLDRN